jgi:hypothetical protein
MEWFEKVFGFKEHCCLPEEIPSRDTFLKTRAEVCGSLFLAREASQNASPHTFTHVPAALQNFKATRPCKAGLPPVLGVKQAKRLTHYPAAHYIHQSHTSMQGVYPQIWG